MCTLELIKTFSANYANAVSALAALGALVVTSFAFWFLKREFAAKYRPYVVPAIATDLMLDSKGFGVSIIPRNVGSHPCEIKLTNIRLHIGDEVHETPDFKDWVLLAPQGMELRMPVGHVNELGIRKIREARYKLNRIEINFVMVARSIEQRFEESKSVCFEIDVSGEVPFSKFMPDWHKRIDV